MPRRAQYAESVSYSQAHLRLKNDRGRAAEHACTACGDRAAHWAYMGGDPDELDWNGRKYSTDQSRYEPMCAPCHNRHDRARADGRSVAVCPKGHPWSVYEALRIQRSGSTGIRYCRACHRESARRWQRGNRERVNAYARERRARLRRERSQPKPTRK